MEQKIKKAVFILFLGMLMLPALQFKFNVIKLKPLGGNYQFASRPSFTWDSWVKMEYQQKYEAYVNDHIGFREFFLRSYNQTWFTFFRKLHARDVIMGKNYTLYERNYIEDYTGRNFRGEDVINEQLRKVKYLQDTLAKENIHLLLFFAPGKASYFPENIPAVYLKEAKTQTNYRYYTRKSKELGINHIDMNAWFVANKNRTQYPLYMGGGIHWSLYGMTLAFDSLCRYMAPMQNAPLPLLHIDAVELSDTARETDNDIEKGLNLLCNLPYGKYAYPKVSFSESPQTKKPQVMVVADSYWWNVFGAGYTNNAWNGSSFWYYNEQVYYDKGQPMSAPDTMSLYNEIHRNNFVIILATEANLYRFGYNFIERLYDIYTGKGDPIADKKRFDQELVREESVIRADENWMNAIRKKAEEGNLPLDTVIRRDAIYMLSLKKNK